MDPVANPYQPGAGRRPPELAGRAHELKGFDVLVRRCEAGSPDRGWVLHGLRGVGKTVLLNELLTLTVNRGWIVTEVEASLGQPVIERVAQGLHRSLRDATGRHGVKRLTRLLAVFRAFSVKVDPAGAYTFGVEIEPIRGVADSGNLATDLSELFVELGTTAADLGVGAALLVDEMQDVGAAELAALNVAVHEVGQGPAPLPFLLIGAGLPSLPAVLANATSYAERLYDYRSIGTLDRTSTREAFVRPAEALGVTWSPAALDLVLDASRGYPFFVQALGRQVWDYAASNPISIDDAEVGIGYARREIDAGLYLARWLRATPVQRDLLRAIAAMGDDIAVSTQEVAQAMGRTRGTISVPRDELLSKGILYAPERGILAFTVPGMSEFVRRQ